MTESLYFDTNVFLYLFFRIYLILSYLSKRKFKFHVRNTFLEPGNHLCRVPQRSILGPLSFLSYINDMPQAADCELLLYTDNTYLLFQYKDITEIEMTQNKNFSMLYDGFLDN